MGRKRKTDERFDLRIRVDEKLHERIKKAADAEGNAVASFVRALVVRELNERERAKL